MTINIKKQFFSIRLKCDILVDGIKEFIAKADILHLPYKPRLSVYDLSKNKVFSSTLASPFFFEYDFVFIDGEQPRLRKEEKTEDLYYFDYKEDRLTIHFNSRHSASIFKGNYKIADFRKEEKYDNHLINCYDDSYKLAAIAITTTYIFDIHTKVTHHS